MKIFAFIFARGGSKGVPRKNIRLLAGKPLIAYAIQTAQGSQHIQRVIVSTDDAEIASIAREYGAEVPFMRPADLAQDNSSEWLAWQHAIANVAPFDVFVSVPTTSPLRSVDDVNACIEMLLKTDADMIITGTPARRSPYYNMVQLDEQGQAKIVIDKTQFVNRQAVPAVYDMTTVAYVTYPQVIMQRGGVLDAANRVRLVVVPAERALDIDSELDLAFAEFVMKKNAE